MAEYKGYKMTVEEEDVSCNELELRAATVGELKKLIDRAIKDRKAPPEKCFCINNYLFNSGNNGYVVGTAGAQHGISNQRWFSDGKHRSVVGVRYLVPYSPETEEQLKAWFQEINDLDDRRGKIMQKVNALPHLEVPSHK